MTQHTPGPWATDNGHAERDGIQIWDTVEGLIIADVVDDQHDNSEANARLIAAAPAMLNALKDTINACFKHTHVCLICDELTGHMDGCAVAAVEIAIAEAEGE